MNLQEVVSRARSLLRMKSANDVPVLGRYEPGEQPDDAHMLDSHREAEVESLATAELEHDLPSANRSSGFGAGYVRIVAGLIAIASVVYVVLKTGQNEEATLAPPRPPTIDAAPIANTMPPLIMPAPTPIQATPTAVAPIALQAAHAVSKPHEPDWTDRKLSAGVLLGEKLDNARPDTIKPDSPKDDALRQIKTAASNASDTSAVPQSTQQKGKLDKLDAVQLQRAFDAAGEINDLSKKLNPMVTQGVSAGILSNRNYLITKGTALDCALETAINSTYSGLVTCRLTRDVYSDNGRVIMLDRGSQLLGEYKSGIDEGMVRIFVLWTRAKTPKGVVVELNSPGTDSLGRTGFEGYVDNHFLERFGAVIMLSLVQESFDYAKAAAAPNGNTGTVVQVAPGTSAGGASSGVRTMDKLSTEMLKKFVNIPPVFSMNQGAHIEVMVVRDLDFSSVYGLELKE